MRNLTVHLVVAALLAVSAAAQDSPVPFPAGAPSSFEFSLSNPGARSLGLGGAFVALADDATAAFSNPAGLVQLARPEVSIEGRHWDYTTTFVEGGRLSGEPSGIGVDVASGTRDGSSTESVDDVSFASFVWPSRTWSLALYHHRQINYRSDTRTNGLFGTEAMAPFTPRHPDEWMRNDSLILGTGASVGVKLSERWSVGLGVEHFKAELGNLARFYLPATPLPDDVYGPASYAPESEVVTVTMTSDDTDWGLLAGVLWQPDDHWGLGAFYREGADFDVRLEVASGPAMPGPPPGTVLQAIDVRPMEFPEVYGLGAAYQSTGGEITASFEWDHVGYSSILNSFETVVGETGAELNDADELHFGFEYALVETSPLLAFRAGAWLDPDHRVRAVHRTREYLEALFPAGEDEWHWTVGLGVAFERIQLDLAADFSEPVDTVALSAIVTF